MGEIRIIEKPESVSYEEIYNLIDSAHEENRKNNIIVNARFKGVEDFLEHIGPDAITYVAMEDDKLLGTISLRYKTGSRWMVKGKKVNFLMHLGVHPEVKGKKIGGKLFRTASNRGKEDGCDASEFLVVARNPAHEIYLHLGYKDADFIPRKETKQNSIYMIKWYKKPKYPQWLIFLYYHMKKAYVKIRYRYR